MLSLPNPPARVDDFDVKKRKLVLSVDDQLAVLRSRQVILEAAGYDVVNASSGAQALGIFSTVQVDLVVLDYYMPGVNGGDVAKVFKARRPELPILMISARPVEKEIFQCVDGFLVKGASAELLVQKIEQLLSAGSMTRLPAQNKIGATGEQPPQLWTELATLASTEQDPETQKALIGEIHRLAEKRDRILKDSAAQLASSEMKRMLDLQKPLPDDGSYEASSK
jgi:CheY-like chemotaxis protein